MAGTITAGALANITQAAEEAGIAPQRVIEALQGVPYTVTWNDGSLTGSAAEFREAIRKAFVDFGIPEAHSSLFCDRIIAIDTGLSGNVTGIVPDLEGLTAMQALDALRRANLVPGTVTGTADLGDFPIGTVDDQQSPAASAADAPGSAVSFDIQLGQTVPDLTDGDGDDTAAEAALTTAGLVGDGTEVVDAAAAGTVLSQDPAADTLVEYGATVAYDYSDGNG